MLKYMNFTPLQIIGMLVFLACMVGFIIWATGFRKKQRDIIGYRNYFFIFSGILFVICIGALIFRGINWGLDFKGGTVIEMGIDPEIGISQVRDAIQEFGVKNNIQKKLENPKVQMEQILQERTIIPESKGPESIEDSSTPESAEKVESTPETPLKSGKYKTCIIQTKHLNTNESQDMIDFIGTKIGQIEVLKQETVGPIIGKELQKKALLALFIALGLQLIYITFRFGTKIRFGLAADIALIHDIIIMIGIYSLLGKSVDSSFLAALLTIIGYSVMDSVVVFDRVRENLDLMKGSTYKETINISLNQTLTRTALTSVTTIITLFALYYFGGATLHNFAIALLIGVVAGTYSSLFVASPLLLLFDNMAKSNEKKRVETRRKKLQDEAEEKNLQKTLAKVSGDSDKPKEKKKKETIVTDDSSSPEEIEAAEEDEGKPKRRSAKSSRKRRR
ncbi:MAG: protein translocase subunit SecF [Candidatus Eremiobacteraeota bacterium]|nr:protein translocase subunit SecF [Candidatus Eremiobacteraeota bacterium]